MQGWLKFFRVVNWPTVPGDALVGMAAIVWGTRGATACGANASSRAMIAASLASLFLYLFGLADNDLVGAKTDGPERPIPAGEISLAAARLARGLCLFLAMIAGACANLPPAWWIAAFLLAVAVVVYDRTKACLAMGLCRGLNVVCGGTALIVKAWRGVPGEGRLALLAAALVWTLYIAVVTKFSEGEETNPAKRRRVGFLIGALVYLQLGALLFFYMQTPDPRLRNLLLAGAGLLILLRILKRIFPNVSAS